ncbi:hypothetical protein FB567DRAFT_589446 [Paraphoma chrysanthemicola]|uniref:Uncharacterized protein n=1 Tax=Paraphoma chrysanthemicola TaxID=798071 RepID=A0A8K0RFF5_9PLEO|nr:hypothetical protein FB567DRAFT_589446 [Paraphoma chrysanthemicola]
MKLSCVLATIIALVASQRLPLQPCGTDDSIFTYDFYYQLCDANAESNLEFPDSSPQAQPRMEIHDHEHNHENVAITSIRPPPSILPQSSVPLLPMDPCDQVTITLTSTITATRSLVPVSKPPYATPPGPSNVTSPGAYRPPLPTFTNAAEVAKVPVEPTRRYDRV